MPKKQRKKETNILDVIPRESRAEFEAAMDRMLSVVFNTGLAAGLSTQQIRDGVLTLGMPQMLNSPRGIETTAAAARRFKLTHGQVERVTIQMCREYLDKRLGTE